MTEALPRDLVVERMVKEAGLTKNDAEWVLKVSWGIINRPYCSFKKLSKAFEIMSEECELKE